eukprot:12919068-Prorocentrum_lima.AAC.1
MVHACRLQRSSEVGHSPPLMAGSHMSSHDSSRPALYSARGRRRCKQFTDTDPKLPEDLLRL